MARPESRRDLARDRPPRRLAGGRPRARLPRRRPRRRLLHRLDRRRTSVHAGHGLRAGVGFRSRRTDRRAAVVHAARRGVPGRARRRAPLGPNGRRRPGHRPRRPGPALFARGGDRADRVDGGSPRRSRGTRRAMRRPSKSNSPERRMSSSSAANAPSGSAPRTARSCGASTAPRTAPQTSPPPSSFPRPRARLGSS